MSDLLRIGASGLSAYSTALTVIGENVSNADTDGYSRRDVSISQTGVGGSSLVYRSLTGSGSVATSVTRASDLYTAANAQLATSSSAAADAKVTWLTNEETALSNGGNDVGTALTAFYNAADTLSADPNSTSSRSAFIQALSGATGAITDTANALASVSSGIAGDAQSATSTLNSDLDQLDKINNALARTATGTDAQASLLDQRDQLIDGISAQADVSATYSANGSVQLTLTSDSSIKLLGNGGARFNVTQASDGRLSVIASAAGTTSTVAVSGGTLGGLVATAASVADRRAQLDSLASKFATSLNSWSASGTDANGDAGTDLVSYDASAGAASLAVTITDPSAVPAASSDGTTNGNLLALDSLRTSDGFENAAGQIVTNNAQQLSAAKTEQTTASAQKDAALQARDDENGVDLDTEAASLLRYQQAYSAASKVIQVARETMQSILDIVS